MGGGGVDGEGDWSGIREDEMMRRARWVGTGRGAFVGCMVGRWMG